jgi:acyl-[acyl-carrier-protein] desaturase
MSEVVPLEELAEVDQERDAALFEVLRKPTERLMNRHMEATREWVPYNYVPFEFLDPKKGRHHQRWDTEIDGFVEPHVQSALIVNTLTEDNLPEYFHLIATHGARGDGTHPFMAWSKQWKTEEARHGKAMDGWLDETRAVDPDRMQQDRDAFLRYGETPQPQTVTELLAYTAMQELATLVSHTRTGGDLGNEHDGRYHGAQKMLQVIGQDEGRHHRFYADLAKEAMREDPSTMMIALGRQMLRFEMPGVGIPEFRRHAMHIAKSGIYGLPEYRQLVLRPTLRRIEFDSVRPEHMSKEGQLAQRAIKGYIDELDKKVPKIVARRAVQPSRS